MNRYFLPYPNSVTKKKSEILYEAASLPQLKDDIIHEAINESASAMNSDSEDDSGGLNFVPPHSQQITALSGKHYHSVVHVSLYEAA